MTAPKIKYTEELHEALADFEQQRTDLFVAGVDLERLAEFVDAVRRVDAATVDARHEFRDGELFPDYPEDYAAEEDGYEAAAELLRAPLPERKERP